MTKAAKRGGAKEPRPLHELAAQVNLRRVRLVSTSATLHREPGGLPESVHYHIGVDASVKQRRSPKNQLVAVLEFSLNGHATKNARVKVFDAEAKFELIYALKGKPFSKADREAFGNTNAIHNAWPYWRELLQSMTCRMGIPPLTIGSFHLKPQQ